MDSKAWLEYSLPPENNPLRHYVIRAVIRFQQLLPQMAAISSNALEMM
jgi:hypothetical protein